MGARLKETAAPLTGVLGKRRERTTNPAAIYADVETTGFSSEADQIVEVGLSVIHDAQEIGSFSSLVFASEEAIAAGEEALKANGIDPDLLRDAPPRDQVAEEMWNFLRPILVAFPDLSFHSFNVGFDRRFLAHNPWSIPRERWGECVMDASMRAMGLSRFPRLGDAIEFFKLKFEGEAHRALPDARMAARVHREILRAREVLQA